MPEKRTRYERREAAWNLEEGDRIPAAPLNCYIIPYRGGITLLECGGFEVVDPGVDVPEKTFVDEIRRHAPQVVGMSGLLTTSIPIMGKTVQAIEEAGLREKVKVIAGGGVVGDIPQSQGDSRTSKRTYSIKVKRG
jgi:hypothetical protein